MLRTLIGVRNDGFVDEDYKVDIKFSSLLGLVRWEDVGNVSQLYAQTSTIAEQVSVLPWYHLMVKADVGMTHRHQAIGDGQPGGWQRINYSYSFLLVPWYMIAGGAAAMIVILWSIVALMKKARKKHKKQIVLLDEQPQQKVRKTPVRKKTVVKAPQKTVTKTVKPRTRKPKV